MPSPKLEGQASALPARLEQAEGYASRTAIQHKRVVEQSSGCHNVSLGLSQGMQQCNRSGGRRQCERLSSACALWGYDAIG